jgi:CheY-like chemotaxis protein
MTTILVVDDDPDVLEFHAAILRAAGHDVIEAVNGVSALDILDEDRQIDLLLTDAVMPGLNGFNLARMAKSRRQAIKVLYLTAHRDQATAMRDTGSQFGKLLTKPIEPAELRKEINLALFARIAHMA